MSSQLVVSLPAVPLSVRKAREKVAEVTRELGVPQHVIEDARLCVSEAATNVVRYAYADGDGKLDIRVGKSDTELTVVVRDEGVGLTSFQREGELGHGLRIIDQLTRRCAITSAPHVGTEVRMVFGLDEASRFHRGA
jgi:anti-sigma regulatory factor (Ser/Thr protein kinase)